MSWPPHITVATVVQLDGRFLMVEELDNGEPVFNQPAGHLDPNETLLDAAIRETLEESAWRVKLTGFSGIYQYYSAHNDTTYLRFCFVADAETETDYSLDDGIIAAHWLTLDEIRTKPLRSPLVLQCIEDILTQPLMSLDRIQNF